MFIDHTSLLLNDEQLAAALSKWNAALFTVVDLRHYVMSAGGRMQPYLLPANACILLQSTSATVTINDNSLKIERCTLLHAGKGHTISVSNIASTLTLTLLLYRIKRPASDQAALLPDNAGFNPFTAVFALVPIEPLVFDQLFTELQMHWTAASPTQALYGRASLTRLFCLVHHELHTNKARPPAVDLAEQAIAYINARYRSNLSIAELQQKLHVSSAQLIRLMKARTGKTPQEYVKHVKLEAARDLLRTTSFSLKEIAGNAGFYDEYHLSHMFKAQYGETPIAYRRNLTWQQRNPYIEYDSQYLYNVLSTTDKQELKEGVEKLMHRHPLIKGTLALALGLVLLAACSSGTTETPTTKDQPVSTNNSEQVVPPATEQETPVAETAIEPENRLIQTPLGEVEVPVHPKRVISSNMLGDLISLGITPLAISDHETSAIVYQELAEPLPTWQEMTPEYIASLEPDLILVFSREQHDALSKIAPTVLFPFFELSAEERLLALGDVLNRQEEAQQAVAAYKQRIADANTRLAQEGQAFEGKTISILEFIWGALYVYGDSFGRGGDILYNGLQLQAPEVVQNEIIAGDQWRELSLEVMHDYAGDYILLSGDVGELAEFVTNPVWLSLPAVQHDRVIQLDFDLFYHNDIYSLNKQIDFLVDQLLEKANQP